jgi:hypothetical protein
MDDFDDCAEDAVLVDQRRKLERLALTRTRLGLFVRTVRIVMAAGIAVVDCRCVTGLAAGKSCVAGRHVSLLKRS